MKCERGCSPVVTEEMVLAMVEAILEHGLLGGTITAAWYEFKYKSLREAFGRHLAGGT